MPAYAFFKPDSSINPYESQSMANGYNRPRALYRAMVKLFKKELSGDEKVIEVLDVGCGTGISSLALKELAFRVTGVDPSMAMLEKAIPDKSVEYLKGAAERLPFIKQRFDAVAACVSFHFFNQALFLKEAARVLKDYGAILIGYTTFLGLQTPAFNQWRQDIFNKKYPAAKANRKIGVDILDSALFINVNQQQVETSTLVTKESLACLIMTMSGPGLAFARGENPNELNDWLLEELEPFFKDKKKQPYYWQINVLTAKRTSRLNLENDVHERVQAALEPWYRP